MVTGLDFLFFLAIYWMGVAIFAHYRPMIRELQNKNAQLERALQDEEPVFDWILDPSLSVDRQRRLKEAIDEYTFSG